MPRAIHPHSSDNEEFFLARCLTDIALSLPHCLCLREPCVHTCAITGWPLEGCAYKIPVHASALLSSSAKEWKACFINIYPDARAFINYPRGINAIISIPCIEIRAESALKFNSRSDSVSNEINQSESTIKISLPIPVHVSLLRFTRRIIPVSLTSLVSP